MSQAEALLNSLSGDDVGIVTANTEEEHIVVGKDRFIRIPESLKRLGVQYDKDIETVTFDCPRYWDEHDLSQMVIYVNYVLPNGEDGRYPVKNVVAIGSTMHFDWTISDNVTQYNGKISFLICAVTTDAEGNEELHWNSELNQDAYISEGLECRESPIHNYPDIITHLLTRMDEVEAIATPEAMQGYTDIWLEENCERILAEIEAKGAATLDTIPADYTETHNMAKEAARTKADAIICSAEGQSIAVSDSSDDYVRGLRVFGKTTQITTTGKNLLAHPTTGFGTRNGLNITDLGDGRIGFYGTATNNTTLVFNPFSPGERTPIPAGTYTASGSPGASVFLSIFIYADQETEEILMSNASLANGKTWTFTLENDAYYGGYLYVGSGKAPNEIVSPQLEAGATATAFEPCSGGKVTPSPDHPRELSSVGEHGRFNVWLTGKNLLRDVDFPATHTDQKHGITCDYEGNGIFHIYGTFTDDGSEPAVQMSTTELNMPFDPDSKYTLCARLISGQPPEDFHPYLGAGSDTIGVKNWLAANVDSDSVVGQIYSNTASGRSAVKDANKIKRFWIYSYNGSRNPYTADFRIQVWLVKGDIPTEFEPYMETVLTVSTPNALLGVPVTSGGNYTDDNDQQWVCDEIDFDRGVYIQRVVQTTISNFELETGPYGTRYIASGPAVPPHKDHVECLCATLPFSTAVGSGTAWIHDGIRVSPVYKGGTFVAKYGDTVVNDLAITYIRSVPIESALSAEVLDKYRNISTNYPHTTVFNDTRAWMELKYNADTKTWISNLLGDGPALKSTTITLHANKWNQKDSVYSQVVTVNGVTPNSKIDLQPSPDQLAMLMEEDVSLTTSNDNGVITVYAIGSTPNTDMTIQVLITEVVQV